MKLRRKILLAVVGIVTLLVIYVVAFNWYFRPSRLHRKTGFGILQLSGRSPEKARKDVIKEALANLSADNAAKYYLEACLVMFNPPYSNPVWDRVDEVIRSGWQEDDWELEDFIKKNETALELVREGNRQKSCSIPFENATMNIVYLGDFRQVARLSVAKAKLLEKKNEYDAAAQVYIDAFRFASNLSHAGSLVETLTSITIEHIVTRSLIPYIRELNDEVVCARLLNELATVENNWAPLHETIQNECIYSQKLLKSYGREWAYMSNPIEDARWLGDAIFATGKAIGYLRYNVQMPVLLRGVERSHRILIEECKRPYPELFRANIEKNLPKNVLVEIWFPAIYKFMGSCARSDADRRATIVRVALQLQKLKHGAYPNTIEQLASLVPDGILTDPLSMKHFIYKRTGAEYEFHSFGLDLDDDGGKEVDSHRDGDDGDMVFTSIPSPPC